MFDLPMILSGLVLLILLGGLFYTLKVGSLVGVRQSEYDTEINKKTQRHPYLLNPVFIAYIIAIVLAAIYIIYHASNN